jgi:LacI family transcriptional regulator
MKPSAPRRPVRGPARGRVRPLVAIVLDTAVSFDREIAAGAAQYAREVGDWQLYIEEEPGNRLPDLGTWNGHGIIASFADERVAQAVARSGIPTIGVGGTGYHDPALGIPHVGTDDERIGTLAAEHLLERGLEQFAYYGSMPAPTTRWSEIRGRAFAARVAAAGRSCESFVPRHEARYWGDVQRELGRWLEALPKPVGVMACHDVRGRHLLESCRSLGLRVPHDVAVVGVDDDELVCELAAPPLTSIAQSTRRIGHEAARLLDLLMRPGRSKPAARAAAVPLRTAIPPVGIVGRASTDTLAVADPLVAGVLAEVRDRACAGLTVTALANRAGMPRWRLEKRFKQAVGHSIHDDIVRVRLAEAQRLIRTTDLPLKAVASRSGFHSIAYLTTLFRRRFGITPGRFRAVEQRLVVRNASRKGDAAE